MSPDHPEIIRLLGAARAGGSAGGQAAVELLELLEPPTLSEALRHPCLAQSVRADDRLAEVVRRAWRTYKHDRGRAWN